jgi:hypothetical protein
MDQNDQQPEFTIVEPTAQQAAEGLAKLQLCFPHWKQTPALLIIKPDVLLIVSATSYESTESGFTVRLATIEKLEAPSDLELPNEVGCGWNQPYMSFSTDVISAPYSFSLYFGAEGVARAREVHQILSKERGASDGGLVGVGSLRACFGDRGAKYAADFKQRRLRRGEATNTDASTT